MMLVVLLAFVAGAFALQDCPVNSHYESCGTACPLTCDNYKNPPRACVLMCNPGCHCDAGYVKANDGSCVMPENCPNRAPEVCGENERYNGCGTACPLTCDNYDNPPKICPAMCRIGCECKKGFIRSQDGRCVRPENCPNRSTNEKNCEDKPDGGQCLADFTNYYYDKETNTCKNFTYGGCPGNGNRYWSEEECWLNCGNCPANSHYETCGTACPLTCDNYKNPPRACVLMCNHGCHCDAGYVKASDGSCVMPENCPNRASANEKNCEDKPDGGMCLAYFPSYYYDKETNTCKKFIYGGCQGNGNRYRTEEECLANCARSSSVSACDQPKVTGPCRALFHRFFFNQETGLCEKFIYGGCGGNQNNFNSQRDCERTCMV